PDEAEMSNLNATFCSGINFRFSTSENFQESFERTPSSLPHPPKFTRSFAKLRIHRQIGGFYAKKSQSRFADAEARNDTETTVTQTDNVRESLVGTKKNHSAAATFLSAHCKKRLLTSSSFGKNTPIL
ncbi:MAG: hypothetical protein ACI3YC_03860, partial [Alloprevotella sp.]